MTASKIVAAAASGAGGGAGLDVDEVFSTFLYTGTGGNATITNGIDLSGEGGLVITKRRNVSYNWGWFDTARGANKALHSNDTDAQETLSNGVTAFNSNGFSIGDQAIVNSYTATDTIASWTFRKAPKFFDVVTYTGNNATQTINHNLGSVPGMIIVKRLNDAGNWGVKHRSIAATNGVFLNLTDQSYANSTYWGDTEPTSTQFTVGTTHSVNSAPYVAYLFAHNNSDGEFGPDSDQDIIKCGSFNTPSSGDLDVSLGFEPQFILFKRSDAAENWGMRDVMRGMSYASNGDARLWPNLSSEEFDGDAFNPTPTGFTVQGGADLSYNATYIYMAIRRGPLAVPEDATKFFAISTNGQAGDSKAPAYRSTFPVDMYFEKSTGGSPAYISSRLTGSKYMQTNATNAEATDSALTYDFMNGVYNSTGSNSAYYGYMWKRAPGYFQVCCYTGSGNNSTRMVDHNLTVKPEMVWIKRRDDLAQWFVTTESLGVNNYLNLESNGTGSTYTNMGAHTATQFSARGLDATNGEFVAYLFATVSGVSKVGSVTHSGSSTDVDCGFASGARFVLLKRTDDTGSWVLFDTVRGITSGNDPYLKLNSTAAQVTTLDQLDPLSSGFQITGDFNDGDYIFYAIA